MLLSFNSNIQYVKCISMWQSIFHCIYFKVICQYFTVYISKLPVNKLEGKCLKDPMLNFRCRVMIRVMVLQQYFSNIMTIGFISGEDRSTLRKSLTCYNTYTGMYAPLSEPYGVSNLHKVWLQCVYFCLI